MRTHLIHRPARDIIAQQAEGARRPASDQPASAQAALEQARSYDRAGQEAQCMDAITRANQFAR